MRATTFYCSFLVLVTGCFFGDPVAHRNVRLQLPVVAQEKAGLSGSGAEVHEALRIVDDIMGSYSVARDPKPLAPNERNAIAIYDVWTATGQKVVYAGPTVYLQDNYLNVAFMEFPARHSSPRVKKICGEIAEKLRSRYGKHSVKIEH